MAWRESDTTGGGTSSARETVERRERERERVGDIF